MIEPIYPMKAKKYKNENPDGYICQPKIDGIHIQILVHGDSPTQIFSANKVKETGTFNDYTKKLAHIVKDIDACNKRLNNALDGHILDGEAIAYNQGDRDFNFRYVSGTLNCLDEESISRQNEKELISAVLYNMPLMSVEYSSVIKFMTDNIHGMTYAKMIDWRYVFGEEYMTAFNDEVKAGGEGIVLYNPDMIYKISRSSPPRTKSILKMKEVNEREVLVVGMFEGQGKQAGTFGGFICEDYRGKRFNVGRGVLKDDELDAMWAKRDSCPFIIEITYHMETPDSYKLPIYMRDRSKDKTIEDWNKSD